MINQIKKLDNFFRISKSLKLKIFFFLIWGFLAVFQIIEIITIFYFFQS